MYYLYVYVSRALQEIRNAKALSGGQHVEQTEAMLEQHKQQHNQSASTQFSYNKKALQMACEGLASSQLPFLETLCVASFPVSEHDDNDDLEREVCFHLYTTRNTPVNEYNHRFRGIACRWRFITKVCWRCRRVDAGWPS